MLRCSIYSLFGRAQPCSLDIPAPCSQLTDLLPNPHRRALPRGDQAALGNIKIISIKSESLAEVFATG